jgi:hypothetical protein
MDPEKEWFRSRGERTSPLAGFGMGTLRVSLLFGMAAVALALLIAPFAEEQSRSRLARGGLDFMSTGTVSAGTSYTIRRSVLQPHPRSVCIIRDNGARSGEC